MPPGMLEHRNCVFLKVEEKIMDNVLGKDVSNIPY